MQLISPVFPRINISHNKNIIRIRDGLFGIRGGGGDLGLGSKKIICHNKVF